MIYTIYNINMAKSFKMPENLDIDYKFFGGKYGFKDIGIRILGLAVAIPEGIVLYLITGNMLWAVGFALITAIIGFILGSKKVFNKTIPVYTAMIWESQASKKTKTLYNKRSVDDTKVGNDTNEK